MSINFENFDQKLQSILSKEEWKNLQYNFNNKKNILIFGHGGNLAVADHSAIDISRLTDKCSLSPGSAIQCTSLISDFSFEDWIKEWLKIILRSIKIEETLIIGLSCSVGSKSSQAIINALEYCESLGINTNLISARHKDNLSKNINQIVNDSIYYHTSEVITLALFYQLIHGYNNKDLTKDLVDCPPPIKISSNKNYAVKGCSKCEFDEFDHSFCEEDNKIKHTPPGLESQNNNLAIDFDGVIHNFNKGYYDGTCYGEPIKGSLEALKKLSKNYNIIIFSSKCLPDRPLVQGKTGKELIIEWLQKYNVLKYVKDITHFKVRAKYYIDDKGISFKNNWEDILLKL